MSVVVSVALCVESGDRPGVEGRCPTHDWRETPCGTWHYVPTPFAWSSDSIPAEFFALDQS